MITTVAADSAFDQVRLRVFATDGSSITVALPGATAPNSPQGRNITDGGADDIEPGDLLMLTKGSASALVQVTRVSGQQVYFDAGDSLGLNQSAAAGGTAKWLQNSAPVDTTPAAGCCVSTIATRVRLITYYLDTTTDPRRPRLVRRINNGSGTTAATTFDNSFGTVVAFDVENLSICTTSWRQTASTTPRTCG